MDNPPKPDRTVSTSLDTPARRPAKAGPLGLVALGLHAGALWLSLPGAAAAEEPKIRVNSVRIEGNTLLPEPTLSGITSGLAGTERSMV